MLKEFKDFALRGNMLDMAVGIIIGMAFGKAVTSMVNDVLMPPLGLLIGKMDFSNLFINLSGKSFASLTEAKNAGAATLNYGLFLNTLVDLVIVSFALFLIIRPLNAYRKRLAAAPAEPDTKSCEACCMAIPKQAKRCPHCTTELKAA